VANAFDRVVARLMSLPRLYRAVQSSIAGPLHRQVRERIAAAIPDAPQVRVLDLGCGVGDYAALFTRARYHGLDIDPRFVETARRSFTGDNITFAVGDARVLSFPDRAFDYCFSVGLYHHLPDAALVESLSQAQRVTSPGCVLVIDAIYPPRGNWPGYLLRKIDRGKHVRSLHDYEELLRSRFDVLEARAARGGFLDYVCFRL
jgi:SAM-dependent methyltransferase